MEIRFEKREKLKEKPDWDNLGFGKYMTDYMFICDWDRDIGWHDARIVPEGPIHVDWVRLKSMHMFSPYKFFSWTNLRNSRSGSGFEK